MIPVFIRIIVLHCYTSFNYYFSNPQSLLAPEASKWTPPQGLCTCYSLITGCSFSQISACFLPSSGPSFVAVLVYSCNFHTPSPLLSSCLIFCHSSYHHWICLLFVSPQVNINTPRGKDFICCFILSLPYSHLQAEKSESIQLRADPQ